MIGNPETRASSLTAATRKPGTELTPLPTADPPNGTSASAFAHVGMVSNRWSRTEAQARNSEPSVTGIASLRWVPPGLRDRSNSTAFFWKLEMSAWTASRSSVSA